jgi:predicted acylesterase/phospholipase RssA
VRGFMSLVLAAALAVTTSACCCHRVPKNLASARNLVDVCAPPFAHLPVSGDLIRTVAAEFQRQGAAQEPTAPSPYHFLALSGGGFNGAFGVGVLKGWSDSGTRPDFDAVTGISVGALVATFAFLGPDYDDFLRSTLVGAPKRQIMYRRPLVFVGAADSLYSSRPLARRISDAITPDILHAVAEKHAQGRRLYIATAELDSRRLVLWDMGEIATRGTPAALTLYRKIVLASASVPVVYPPVRLPIQIDGVCYDELHADGSTCDGAVFRAFIVGDRNRSVGVPGAWAPAGSTLHVIVNGKLYSEPTCVRGLFGTASAALDAVMMNKKRDELHRIYLNCLQTGVAYRQTAVPQELDVPVGALQVTPADQLKLYESGYRIGQHIDTGEGWRDVPPGVEPAEQAMPRTGIRFVTGKAQPETTADAPSLPPVAAATGGRP